MGACESETASSPEAEPHAQVVGGDMPPAVIQLDAEEPQPWSPHYVWDQRAILEGFRWSDVAPLPDHPPDSTEPPPVYYVQIYVRSPDELRELEELGVHYDPAPLFDAEWPNRPVLMTFEGDPDDQGGLFVYCLMPAITYNAIREATLAGEETYRAMILREVPEEARAPDGSVSYEHMADNFGEFAPPYEEIVDEGEVGPPTLDGFEVQERIGRRLRNWVRRKVSEVREAVDLVRRGVGLLIRAFRLETTLRITVDAKSRAENMPGKLLQAWGAEFGQPLPLANTRVNVQQWGGIALHKARTNDQGFARVKVGRDRRAKVCVEGDSAAARLEHGVLFPVRVCSKTFVPKDKEQEYRLQLDDESFHALAQIIDGRKYASRALGFRPPKAMVQRGWIAKRLSHESRPYVPCLAATNASNTVVEKIAAGLTSAVPFAGVAAELLFTTDIMLPDGSANGRSTSTHEYGHFFLCTLLAHENPQAYDRVWSDVVEHAFLDDASEIRGINEGFADWFASQVAGGVNYFDDQPFGEPANGDFMFSTNGPTLGRGMESNYGAPLCISAGSPPAPACQPELKSGIDQQAATIATLLHDIVDRTSCNAECQNVVSDAAVWGTRGPGGNITLVRSSFDAINDEEIEAGPFQLVEALRAFSRGGAPFFAQALNYESFFHFLTEELAKSYTPDQICRLFALHTQGRCASAPPAPALPPAAGPPSPPRYRVTWKTTRNGRAETTTTGVVHGVGTCGVNDCEVEVGSAVEITSRPNEDSYSIECTEQSAGGRIVAPAATFTIPNINASWDCVLEFTTLI
jgi:hypothetical protein